MLYGPFGGNAKNGYTEVRGRPEDSFNLRLRPTLGRRFSGAMKWTIAIWRNRFALHDRRAFQEPGPCSCVSTLP